jgi:hypothetical protein
MATLFSRPTTGVTAHEALTQWEREGLVTSELAARLRATLGPTSSPALLTPGSELASYLGIVVALASGAFLTSRLWHGLGVGGRVVFGLVLAAVGLAAGFRLVAVNDPAAGRLGRFLWFIGTGGAALATAVAGDYFAHHRPGITLLVTGLVMMGVSGPLWANRPRPLQFLATSGGMVLSVVGIVVQAHWRLSPTVGGLIIWGAAAGLAVVARTVLEPSMTAFVCAVGGSYLGALLLLGGVRPLGLALGMASAVAVTALGLRLRSDRLTALGVLGVLIFAIRVIASYVRGFAPLVGVFGLALVVVVLVVARALRARGPRSLH